MTEEKQSYEIVSQSVGPREIIPAAWEMINGIGRAPAAVKKVLYCYENGLPLSAADSLYVVNGKLAPMSDIVAKQVRAHPHYDYEIIELDDKICTVRIFRLRDGEMSPEGEVTFTIEMAVRAGLADKDVWKKYPEDMLFGKAMTRAQRRYAPDALTTPAYTPEEMGEFEGVVVDVMPSIIVEKPKVAIPQEDITKILELYGPRTLGIISQQVTERNITWQDVVAELPPDAFEAWVQGVVQFGEDAIYEANDGKRPANLDELGLALAKLESKKEGQNEDAS